MSGYLKNLQVSFEGFHDTIKVIIGGSGLGVGWTLEQICGAIFISRTRPILNPKVFALEQAKDTVAEVSRQFT